MENKQKEVTKEIKKIIETVKSQNLEAHNQLLNKLARINVAVKSGNERAIKKIKNEMEADVDKLAKTLGDDEKINQLRGKISSI